MFIAKSGFETEFESLTAKKAALEVEKSAAKEAACAEIDAKFAERETLMDEVLAKVSEEIPDPVEDSVPEDTENVEAVAEVNV